MMGLQWGFTVGARESPRSWHRAPYAKTPIVPTLGGMAHIIACGMVVGVKSGANHFNHLLTQYGLKTLDFLAHHANATLNN
jgi:hypothetical protein